MWGDFSTAVEFRCSFIHRSCPVSRFYRTAQEPATTAMKRSEQAVSRRLRISWRASGRLRSTRW